MLDPDLTGGDIGMISCEDVGVSGFGMLACSCQRALIGMSLTVSTDQF